MKIKVSPNLITLFAIISAGLSCYHLINPDIKIIGLNFEDIALVMSLMWGFYTWINLLYKPNPKFNYLPWMIGIVFLIIFSSWQSLRLYDQLFFLGFRVQRNFLTWCLLYFPVCKSIYYNKFSIEDVKRLIRIIGIIELILFITQYVVSSKFNFLYVGIGLRYGNVRYYFQPVLLDLLFFIELDNFIKRKNKKKILSAVIIALILFEVMVVQKYRLTSIALIICFVFGVLIAKSSIKVKLAYVVLGTASLVILYNTQLVQDVIDTIFSNNVSTLGIREIGRNLYIDTLKIHPILGGGFPNEQCYTAYKAAGIFERIFIVDNGMFGFAYIYGGIGVIWLITLWFSQLKRGWRLFKDKGIMVYLIFPLFFVITGINEAHWYWDNGFMVMVLFLALQEAEFKT